MNQELFIKNKVIPVYNHTDVEVLKKIIDNLVLLGGSIFEFTNRSNNGLEVFTALNEYCAKYPDFQLGVGTIFDKATAQKYKDREAAFIISPVFSPEISEWAKEENIFYIPGCSTVTEFFTAAQSGHQFIKLFPASTLGTSMLKAIKSVLPNLLIMPTGGVKFTNEDINNWLSAGACCVGIGEQYVEKLLQLKKSEIKKMETILHHEL
jgi:2-dehydro-3-deoxyphosphogluconate aldolase / (4S)-4-hydroxy-2-oxoglutarate aldolase